MSATPAILLLAYGGPDSLDDIPAFLRNVRDGRPVPPPMVEEWTRRYRLIGGRSPLLDITRRLAARVQEATGLSVYVGMRHWSPYIPDVVAQARRDGVRRLIALCLAPHYSSMSTVAYRSLVLDATQAAENRIDVDFIESWPTQPRYVRGVADNLRATLASGPAAPVKVIFTAHSLPLSIRESCEPYEAQLLETAQQVAQAAGLADSQWMLAYQSAPRTQAPWLEPQIEQLVPQCAAAGDRDLVIAPIGFVADHLEVLYDLDIALAEIARAHGVRLRRTPMLNDSPALVAALAELINEQRGVTH